MEQGRLGANGTTRRRSSGRAAQKLGSSDPELSAARQASGHAARKPGSSDPELSAAGRADESTRTTRRTRRGGPPEDRACGVIIRWKRSAHSSEDGGLTSHHLMGRGALTNWMIGGLAPMR